MLNFLFKKLQFKLFNNLVVRKQNININNSASVITILFTLHSLFLNSISSMSVSICDNHIIIEKAKYQETGSF